MKTILTTITTLCLLAGTICASENKKPIALIGPDYAVKIFHQYVTEPLGYSVEIFTKHAPVTEEYKNFDSVVFLERFLGENSEETAFWDKGDALESVREYLREGGRVFIFSAAFPRNAEAYRNLTFCDDVLGFSRYPQVDLVNPVHAQEAGKKLFSAGEQMDFVASSITVGQITSAEILATVEGQSGEEHPFATRNQFGKGAVYFFGTSPFRLWRSEKDKGNDPDGLLLSYAAILQKAFQ